jgi:hypothetical protein
LIKKFPKYFSEISVGISTNFVDQIRDSELIRTGWYRPDASRPTPEGKRQAGVHVPALNPPG